MAEIKWSSGGGCLVGGFITEWGGSGDPLCRKKKRWGDHALRRTTTVVSASPMFSTCFISVVVAGCNVALGYQDTLSLNWLINIFDRSMNGVLAYEKIEENIDKVLYLLSYLQQLRKINGPHLILTPNFKDVAKESKLSKIKRRCTIVDHIHLVTKEKSVLSKMLMSIESRSSMVITRTLPKLDGDLSELPIFLNFWLPKVFITNRKYKFGLAQKPVIIEMMKAIYSSFPSQYPKSELPKIKEAIFRVGMSEVQMQYYRAFIESTNTWVCDILTNNGNCSREDEEELLKLAINLCECCCHPYMVQPLRGPPHKNDNHLIDNSGKMEVFVEILNTFQDQPKKLVVFSKVDLGKY
ncbi:SNF2 family amino-terminal protein [Medicago truncatula]|uniref:SNF2 family amino-terminal protein n=1 Tax=Medicago truncatula TaxID=3880 RepID=A0A072TWB4_MEDTR|nr:SNF2 family amino-terminal protein [Medicago truncatula]